MWLLAGVASLYALWLRGPPWLDAAVTSWLPVLINALTLYLLLGLLAALQPGRRRRAWQLVAVGTGFDLLASVVWIGLSGTRYALPAPFADVLALLYYPVAAAAGVLFFLDVGGSFRRWTTWLDILTLALGIGVTLWLFFLGPRLPQTGAAGVERSVLIAYALGSCLVMVIVSLLAMSIANWREQCSLAWLIVSATIGFVGVMGWIGSPQRGQFELGSWYSLVGSVIPYCLLGQAVQVERRGNRSAARPVPHPGPWLNSLPALMVLIAIALQFAELANLQSIGGELLIACIVAGAVLVGLRQRDLRFEFEGLQKALARQDVEIGLSELVRRSADLITLVDTGRRLVYVSPAAPEVVGRPAAALRLTPAAALLGRANEPRLHRLLDEVMVRHLPSAEIETSFVDPRGEARAVRVVGSYQLDNPAIDGIVLTLHDITQEQRLEREVLDCASRERARLSSDVHDGVGQELTGIALLLKSLHPQVEYAHGSLARSLQQIERHVQETIRLTQRLEAGLAPVPPGRGTLENVLEHLAAEAGARFGFAVGFQPAPLRADVSTAEAEHLYRIAQESINNAARHSGCRCALIRLECSAGHVVLTVEDDGCGVRRENTGSEGLGMRMMAYRARILGATLHIEPATGGGTRVSVILARPEPPLPDHDLELQGDAA